MTLVFVSETRQCSHCGSVYNLPGELRHERKSTSGWTRFERPTAKVNAHGASFPRVDIHTKIDYCSACVSTYTPTANAARQTDLFSQPTRKPQPKRKPQTPEQRKRQAKKAEANRIKIYGQTYVKAEPKPKPVPLPLSAF